LVFAGLFEGLSLPEPFGVSFNIAPGVGEIFQMPFLTADGLSTSILIDAVPGGPLSGLVSTSAEDKVFIPSLVDALRAHAPTIWARVDRHHFALRRSRDHIQGAITPAVRHAYTLLPSGTLALAIGDAWITNDPLAAQGANLGSHCAWVAADAIATGGPFDDRFGSQVEAKMWEFAGPVTDFSNALLQPPPQHIAALITAAGSNQIAANTFASGFADPVATAAMMADPDAVDQFLTTLV
jgi:hypothetical protein